MPRPPSDLIPIGARIPEPVVDAVDEAAKVNGVSRSAVLVAWLRERAEEDGYLEPVKK